MQDPERHLNNKIQSMIDRMQKCDNSQDIMQGKEQRNNLVESNRAEN